MLRESFDVEIEGGRRLGSPNVIKNDVFEALHGRCEWWFLWGEQVAWVSLLASAGCGVAILSLLDV